MPGLGTQFAQVRTGDTTWDILEARRKALGKSHRGLAKLLAAHDEMRSDEAWRRALYRYRAGSDPEPALADLMESVLELPTGTFTRHDPAAGQAKAAVLTRAQLTAGLEELEGTVSKLERTVARLSRRLHALEHPLSDEASADG